MVRFLRLVAAVSLTLALLALIALPFAPKDAGTMTLYGLVIGLNLITGSLFWPVVRFLQRRIGS